MLQGEALRRHGERSSPLQVCFDFATSLFGLGSARVSRVGDRVLAIADFSIKTGAQATCLPVLAASRNDISVGKLGW